MAALHVVAEAFWRVLILLAIGVAPYAAPMEPGEGKTIEATFLHLVLGLLSIVLVTSIVRWLTRIDAVATGLAWLVLFLMMVLSVVLEGEVGPLGRAVWVASPVVWAAIGAFVGAIARRHAEARSRRRTVIALALVGIAISVASLVHAGPRIRSRVAMWRGELDGDPGNDNAAVGLAEYFRRRGRGAEGDSVLAHCVQADPSSCACVEDLAEGRLDRGLHRPALDVLEQGKASCGDRAAWRGMHAEGLVGIGAVDEALREANDVLSEHPLDPHAAFAKAHALFLKGDLGGAKQAALHAKDLGRGVGARLLLGLLAFQEGKLDEAKRRFQQVLERSPDNASATYDLALVAHKEGRYHDAREGYLKTLQLDPRSFDARYNLYVLTRDAGATIEAQHHLDVLKKTFPNDPRLRGLP